MIKGVNDKMAKQNEEETKYETIPTMKDLVNKLIEEEFNYKIKKAKNKEKYNKMLLDTNWDELNEERKQQGLPKLSNQSMKEAYIETVLSEDYTNELEKELEYNTLRRFYDVSMKYSFDILR